ncbi:MAG: hypothetical protein J6V21_02720 [Alistipes sp.]|nr:hypothetical protein [Alistipes sp.]
MTKIFMAVVAGMFAFSCVTDTTVDSNPTFESEVGGAKTVLSVGIANSEELRTQLGAWGETGYPMYWSNGDKISVNGVASNELSLGEGVKTAAAEFGFGTSLNTPYCVAYPAAAEGQVKFAANQSHTNNTTFGDNVAAMWGYSENGEGVQLNHLTGVLKIGVVADEALVGKKLTYAQVSTIDRAPIAGDFAFDFAEGTLGEAVAATEVISYSFGEGVELSAEPTYLHIAVPAGVYQELYVTLYDEDGGVMYATVKAGDSKPLAAGKVREFKKDGVEQLITYAPSSDVYVVKSADDLVAFAAEAATLEKDMLLVKDIDMEGIEWTPIEGYASTVLGNGYAIKNLNAPLFGTTNASFKGLHLQVNMSSNERLIFGTLACHLSATDEVAPSVEHCTVSGTITIHNETPELANDGANDTDLNFGGLVGRADGVSFKNCENKATINVTQMLKSAAAGTRAPMGGLIGYGNIFTRSNKSVIYTDCINLVNSGAINYNIGEADKNVGTRVGGVVGTSTNNVGGKLENCVNKGDITIHTTHTTTVTNYCGGISPVFYGSVTNCSNYGNLVMSGVNNGMYHSGIIAYVNNAETTPTRKWSGCANYGKISLESATTNSMYLGGLGGRVVNVGIDNCHNYGEVYASSDSYMKSVLCAGIAAYHETVKDSKLEVLYMKDCTNNAPINFWASTVPETTSTYGDYKYRLGGIAGYSNARVESCTNNAEGDITIKGNITQLRFDTNDLAARLGCLVAGCLAYKSNKVANNLTNYGDVTFDATLNRLESIDADLFLAGCMGTNTLSAEMQNFKNYGDIIVGPNSDIKVQRAHIAGVLGDGLQHGGHATVGASNQGNISVGGKITTVAPVMKKSDNTTLVLNEEYIAIGGIRGTGRVKANVNNGVQGNNKVGNITISAQLDSKLIAVGGVVGYGNCISNNINYGNISSTSTALFNGHTAIAGITGYSMVWKGNLNAEDKVVSGIKNYGNLDIKGSFKKDGRTGTNEMMIAGCVCDCDAGDYVDNATDKSAIKKIDWHNYGKISVDASSTITGLISGVSIYMVSNGDLVEDMYNHEGADINVKSSSNVNFYLSGITYRSLSHLENAQNDGNITFSGNVAQLYIGGILGNDNNWKRENLTNNGAITVQDCTGNHSSHFFIGGIVPIFSIGNTWVWENCHNTGDITTTNINNNKNLNIGGILAVGTSSTNDNNVAKAEIFSNCSNSGDINAAGNVRRPYIGGLFGYFEYGTSNTKCPRVILQDCTNSGDINCSTVGTATDSNEFYLGGIISRINQCWMSYEKDGKTVTWSGTIKNTGNIKFNGKINTTTKQVFIGGIVARHKKDAIGDYMPAAENLTYVNEGNIEFAPADNATYAPYIGGVIGHADATGGVHTGFSNAIVNCDIKAWGATNVGMIFGQTRNDSRKATNCQVAGSIDKGYYGDIVDEFGTEKTGWTADVVDISATNFFNYIYSTAVTEDVAKGDGCSFYVAPTTDK